MPDAAPSKTILVVDDEPINIQLLAGMLKSSYRVKVATTGEKALKIARAEPPPDLILLDVMMPGIDGYEVCQTLRSEGSNIPIVFVSGHTEESEKEKGIALGAQGFLSKPFEPEPVLNMVTELVG